MPDNVLYESSSTFFQLDSALPPLDPCKGLDRVPLMFRTGKVAHRLAVAMYIKDIVAERALNDYVDTSMVETRCMVDRMCGQYLEALEKYNSSEALQTWYLEIYRNSSSEDEELIFHGNRPYPKHMDSNAIQTWLQREFNPGNEGDWSYTVMNPQPHPLPVVWL